MYVDVIKCERGTILYPFLRILSITAPNALAVSLISCSLRMPPCSASIFDASPAMGGSNSETIRRNGSARVKDVSLRSVR